jgi:hypothetical protein
LTDRDQPDRAIERMLRGGAGAVAGANAACVDGETLAAWSSGALGRTEALQVEEHVADCARCQAMLAAFARTEPIADVPVSGWRGKRFRWLIPFATAATVAGIWMTLPQRNQPAPSVVDPRARVEAERLPAPVESVPVQPAAPSLRDQTATPPQKPASEREADATVPGASAGVAAGANAAGTRATDRLEAKRESPSASAPMAAPTPAAPPPPPRLEETFAVSRESRQLLASAGGAEFASPDGTTRWRVVDGQVQRSTTEGKSWDAVALPSAATITAGHSPSPSVVWLVGRSGAIFVTTDGTTFERLPFVSSADLSSVMAIDGRQATVATVDGRIYGTSDRGITWIQP